MPNTRILFKGLKKSDMCRLKLKIRDLPRLCLMAIFVLFSAGCANSPQRASLIASAKPIPLGEPRQKDCFLELGDSIELKFFYYPELNELTTIRPDGMISLQLVGEIRAIGLTPSGLTEILKQKYSDYLDKPEVVVQVRELVNERVYVGGEVRGPGEIPIKGRLTLMQSLLKVGGLTDQAKSTNIIVLRLAQSHLEVFKVNIEEILEKGSNDILLQPLDIVYVPKTFIAEAGQFVNQYINQIIPRAAHFTAAYQLRDYSTGGGTIIIGGQ